jgi:flagellin-like protein
MKSKKGLSEVVTTVIMIALVMAAAAIIWGVISNMINKSTEESQACFGNYNKVTLYGQGTCYDALNSRLSVYVDIKDIQVSKVLVLIHTESETKTIEIPGNNADVALYSSSPVYENAEDAIPPNSGKRFWVRNINSKPTSVELVPVINGNQCEISSTIKNLNICT